MSGTLLILLLDVNIGFTLGLIRFVGCKRCPNINEGEIGIIKLFMNDEGFIIHAWLSIIMTAINFSTTGGLYGMCWTSRKAILSDASVNKRESRILNLISISYLILHLLLFMVTHCSS